MYAPGVVAGGVRTGGIVEECKVTAIDGVGAETAPAGVFVEDAVSALIEMQFPDAAFGQVVGTTFAGNGCAFLEFDLGVKTVDGCVFLRWQGRCERIGFFFQQFKPENLRVGIAE